MSRQIQVLIALLVPWPAAVSFGQEPAATDDPTTQRLRAYQLTIADGDSTVALNMTETSVLNWSNPVFGTTDGGFFLWTDNGHVAAVMKTYRTKNSFAFEQMRSFSTQPIVARDGENADPFWAPASAPELLPLGKSPTPATSKAARLIQMKGLHRSFTVTGRLAAGVQELRPLPQPLYRYKSEIAVDGALFAYVQGTGPDMLLLLEVRMVDDHPHWFYALGSIGIFEADVVRHDETVWSEARRTVQSTGPSDIYFSRRLD